MVKVKKYKLVKANNNQTGGNGYMVSMPMSPFSSQFSVMSPALPMIPQDVAPGFGPYPPIARMGPIINLNPPQRGPLAWLQRFSREASELSDGLPRNMYTDSEPQPTAVVPTSSPLGWYKGYKPNGSQALIHNVAGVKKYYTGAGVIIFEVNTTTGRHAVILAMDTDNNYQDFGGGINLNNDVDANTLRKTAMRELAEESRNLFNISPGLDLDSTSNNYVVNGEYRCYVIPIRSGVFNETDFVANRYNIDRNGSGLGHGWKETVGIAKFYISDIQTCLNNNNTACPDVNGISKNIYGRTRGILGKFVLDGDKLKIYVDHPFNAAAPTTTINNAKEPGLMGTKTILIS